MPRGVANRTSEQRTRDLTVTDQFRPSRGWRRGLQSSEHRSLLVGGDILAAAAAVMISLWVWTLTAGVPFSPAFVASHASWFLVIPIWAAVLTPAYHVRTALSVQATVKTLLRAAGVLLLLYLAIYFYAPRQALPRLMALYVAWEATLLTLAWRLTYIWVFTETPFRRRVLIVGAGRAGRTILKVMRDAGVRHTVVVGFVDDDAGKQGTGIDGVRVLGASGDLLGLVHDHHASEIIVSITGTLRGGMVQALVDCQQAGVDLVRMTTVYETLLRRVPVEHLEPNWLFTSLVDAVGSRDASRLAKRALDLVGAAAGAVILTMLLPLAALAVWIDSRGPIFFRQVRVGRGGTPFKLVKFRTMVPDAEAEGEPQWAEPEDPRVTRVGRLLRPARLDELPQVINVLRGEMSLVGPRPERPEFVASLERQIPFYRTRLIVRPGVTGWAQINYPYGGSVEDALAKLEYDLYYIKHRSLFFDLWIVVRTIGTVLRLTGT